MPGNQSPTKGNTDRAADTQRAPVAVFWDQSLIWGLLCIETLGRAGIPFRLLGAADIARGSLDDFRVLLVPGGWAAHKVRALGEAGKKRIAGFIDEGGAYIGFCGGAGMALSSPPALYLTPIERMPLSERLPSASGRIGIRAAADHPAWDGIPEEIQASVWWPSQFRWGAKEAAAADALALYSAPGPDFQVADLRVSDIGPDIPWPEFEKVYGINLDPARIKGHPAMIEYRRGKGRLVLSYAHLETPGDRWANRLLFNILGYLDNKSEKAGKRAAIRIRPSDTAHIPGERALEALKRATEAAAALISFGEANLLWNWREPWLLNWRRGIRGLEYSALFVSLSHLAGLGKALQGSAATGGEWDERAERMEKDALEFCALARRLLLEEKIATQTGIVSKLGTVNERVDNLRATLFGNKMNHGGLCRGLFDQIDSMLLDLINAGSLGI